MLSYSHNFKRTQFEKSLILLEIYFHTLLRAVAVTFKLVRLKLQTVLTIAKLIRFYNTYRPLSQPDRLLRPCCVYGFIILSQL